MDSLNRMALELIEEAMGFADELGVAATELENGATAVDFGHESPGGIEAGLLLAEIQTAGLATVQTRMGRVADSPRIHVELTTDRPAFALLCSQKAGWELAVDGYEGLGSGPARALVADEEVFARVGYGDDFEFAVLALESDEPPTEALAKRVAERTGLPTEAVFLASAPTASLAGSVTVAARAAELSLVRLSDMGYDPLDVRSVSASAPLPPVAENEASALGRTTDALAYGGEVHMTVAEDSPVFSELASSAAADYGTPFETIFEEVGWAFEDLPEELFAPASVTVDVLGGPTHTHGARSPRILAESFGL